jgi:hypothetical protein
MSGYREEDYTLRVTHVVAGSILSEKCAAAFVRATPVMTKDWIEAVWKDSQVELVHATDVKYALHACPIFYKLTIGVSQSQLNADLKNALKKTIEANGKETNELNIVDCSQIVKIELLTFTLGGTYTGKLKRNETSVFVIPYTVGDKFRYAQLFKVPCVLPDWVEASKSAGHVLPVKEYSPVQPKTSTAQNSMVEPHPELR